MPLFRFLVLPNTLLHLLLARLVNGSGGVFGCGFVGCARFASGLILLELLGLFIGKIVRLPEKRTCDSQPHIFLTNQGRRRLLSNSLDEHEEELERVPHGDEDHQVVERRRGELERLYVELHAHELHLGRLLRLAHSGAVLAGVHVDVGGHLERKGV